jgi:hypothetical protein
VSPDGDVADVFTDLIWAAEAKYGQRVVVLVDEYDKPILDNLDDPGLAAQVRDQLAGLYGVIKDADQHIKFVMLTGVSKFSKVNLFSGLNNLRDISLDAGYSAVCGYTEDDLDEVFAPELNGLDRDKIRAWYNGYNWRGEAVYNPFDLLLLFATGDFRAHWFETGTPTFLIDTLTQRQFYLPALDGLEATDAMLSTFDIGGISTEALLFQTGYLTIAAEHATGSGNTYLLRFPNREVRTSLAEALLAACSPDPSPAVLRARKLPALLKAGDLAGIEELFRAHLASIPHDWYRKNPMAAYEGYYAALFYTFFASLGLGTVAEDTSNTGQLDLAVQVPGHIYLFELKVTGDQPQGTALAQILAKDYAAKYRATGLPIHLVGIEISRKTRNITTFDTQTIPADTIPADTIPVDTIGGS